MKDSSSTKVLIVDDQPEIGQTVTRWLRTEGLDCDVSTDGKEAIALIKAGRYAVVVANITMPGLTGPDLLALINTLPLDVCPIMVAARSEVELARTCIGLGAYAYVTKPLNKDELVTHIKGALENRALAPLLDDPSDVAGQTLTGGFPEFRGFVDFHSREEEVIHRLLSCYGLRNSETPSHLRRVGIFSSMLAEALGWERSAIEDIRLAAPLHDIGKMALPEAILNKHDKLNVQEVMVFRTHPIKGSLILGGSKVPMVRMAHDIALYHHERWDGSGYPAGLSAETIPAPARLVAVVDVFDALLRERRFRARRPGVTEHRAIALMKRKKGSHFDPLILECFLGMMPAVRKVHEDFPDKGEIDRTFQAVFDDTNPYGSG